MHQTSSGGRMRLTEPPWTASGRHRLDAAGPADGRPPAARPASVRRASPLAWAFLGFLVGAIFWHFIGFWGFVSQIVFTGRPAAEDLFVEQTGSACITLALDRATGQVAVDVCPPDAPLLNEGALAARGDFGGPRLRRALVRSASPIRLSAGD